MIPTDHVAAASKFTMTSVGTQYVQQLMIYKIISPEEWGTDKWGLFVFV